MGQKANSQISQEQEEIPDGQHDSNSLNNSQDGDVEITNHQKGTQSIKSVPADKLMNGHKCTTTNLQSQTEEKEEKTTGSFESTKLAATIQSVSSAVTSPSNPPCTSSSRRLGARHFEARSSFEPSLAPSLSSGWKERRPS